MFLLTTFVLVFIMVSDFGNNLTIVVKMDPNPYESYMFQYKVKSLPEFYCMLHKMAWVTLGLNELPFPLSAITDPPNNKVDPEIHCFVDKCTKLVIDDDSDAQVIKLIKTLKEKPPKESFENPKLPNHKCTSDEYNLMFHIYLKCIDLPGSKFNPYGNLHYFSNFFIDVFFGNFTEYNEHIQSVSGDGLKRELERREGYCQFTVLFAPILGTRMVKLDTLTYLRNTEKEEIRKIYTGANENRHLHILQDLLERGADPNAHDIYGNTPLFHALSAGEVDMAAILLKYGANPDAENWIGNRPLQTFGYPRTERDMRFLDLFLKYNSKPASKNHAFVIRVFVDSYGNKDFAARVREAWPREANECEKCMKPAEKKCSACKLVFYCTPACQKKDWVIHKTICKKNRQSK